MTWRLEIEHVTRFVYEVPVEASYNEVRLSPVTSDAQITVDAQIEVTPTCRLQRYRDYWGSLVHVFDLHHPHEELLVAARAVVETDIRPARRGRATWAELQSAAATDEFCECLAPTRHVPLEPFAAVAEELRAACSTPADALDAATAWAHEQLAYQPGSTDVATSAADAWDAGRGVCQDLAHVSLAVLRAMGVPARYVSGYLHPDAAGTVGITEIGESHAWIEAWTGSWSPADPTNRVPVGERHVLVARGRDYADVPPVKGVFSGHGTSTAEVNVEITRVA